VARFIFLSLWLRLETSPFAIVFLLVLANPLHVAVSPNAGIDSAIPNATRLRNPFVLQPAQQGRAAYARHSHDFTSRVAFLHLRYGPYRISIDLSSPLVKESLRAKAKGHESSGRSTLWAAETNEAERRKSQRNSKPNRSVGQRYRRRNTNRWRHRHGKPMRGRETELLERGICPSMIATGPLCSWTE
jgi:hypothetical protein